MRVGVPTEVKESESRVAITPAGARELTTSGHEVLVQRGAGLGSALRDSDYERAGAQIVPDAETAWGEADVVLKVKEPIASEFGLLRADPHAVHLPPSRRGAAAHRGADQLRLHGHRL
jgi:alanine dehydrogenase